MVTKGAMALVLALSMAAATNVEAATVVNTGQGSAGANSAVIAAQTSTFGQFTLTQDVDITAIEFFGTIATAGTASFALYFNDRGSSQPGLNVYFGSQQLAAAPTTAGWYGKTDVTGITLFAGTWWVGAVSDGVFNAIQYGDAPNGLGEEALYLPTGMFVDADARNLSWRISGNAVEMPVTPAVPEPATWAMMIAGLAAVAWRLRTRGGPLLVRA